MGTQDPRQHARAAVIRPAVSVWLSPVEVCGMWPGMTVRKLERFRAEGVGPAYSKFGRTITYAEADVLAFIQSHRVSTRQQS